MAMQPPPSAHAPTSGMAKVAVYTKCSAKGCTEPVMGSVTKEAWWWEWYMAYRLWS